MNNEHAHAARLLKALTDQGGECTRTQLLNQMQSAADISPYALISALDALEKQGKITQREEHGTVYVACRTLEKENLQRSGCCSDSNDNTF